MIMKRGKFLSILGISAVSPKIVLEAVKKSSTKSQIPVWTNDGSLYVEHKDFDYSTHPMHSDMTTKSYVDNNIGFRGGFSIKGKDLVMAIKKQS